MATYRKAEAVVENYNREFARWEHKIRESRNQPKKNGMRRPKRKASETSSDNCRRRAEGKSQSAKPATESDSFHAENNTAGFLRYIHKECALWFCSTGRIVMNYLLYFFLRL